jgi:HEAT repeat-containing protein 5
MEKHMALLNDSNTSNTRVPLGLAQSIAVIIQASTFRPMYFANDNAIAIWKLANTQLQLSAKSDLRSSQVQIQIAWNLIGALMSIGTPFVKSHVGQLLLLWHNALPRPLPRDKMATSNVAELHYLLHVRDRALAALSLFLQYNIKILTHDLSTRIHGMLSDTATFVGRLPPTPATEDSRLLSAHSQLVDIAVRVKMRVFKCYCQLVGQDFRKIASPEILMNAIAVFVETDPLISKSASAKSPVGSSFESLSLVTDNFAFGVTSHQSSQLPKFHIGEEEPCSAKRDSDDEVLDRMVYLCFQCTLTGQVGMSVLGSLENDVSQIYCYGSQITEIPLPVPSATALVDSAIDLFSLMVFDQPLKIQESAFAQIAASLGEPLLGRNPGRKAAITKNVAIAVSKALNGMSSRLAREIGQSVRVKTLLLDILKV